MSGGLRGWPTLFKLRNRWISPKTQTSSLNLNSSRCFSVSSSKNMKLLQFTTKRCPCNVRVGYLDGDNVVDINKADPSLSSTLLEILKNDQLQKVIQLSQADKKDASVPLAEVKLFAPITGMDKVLCIGLNYKDHCEEQKLSPPPVPMIFNKFPSCVVGPSQPVQLRTNITQLPTIPLSEVSLVAPITCMDKVLCIGLNYRDHCEEHKLKAPPVPMIFSKFASTVVGPSQPVRLRTKIAQKVDWEVELVVVIGKEASNIKAAQAYDYVAGYTIAQDISARDWQKDKNAGQFLLGKSMDTFCPIGPWITTSDEIPDPETLAISCTLNGVLKQKSRTDQLVHKIPDVLERLTSVMTLLPGDILLTGTPGGVGMYRSPPEYLKPGDVIVNEIEKIGVLEVKVAEFKQN